MWIGIFLAVNRIQITIFCRIETAGLDIGLKRQEALCLLEQKWQQMLEHEEKMKRYQKKAMDTESSAAWDQKSIKSVIGDYYDCPKCSFFYNWSNDSILS